MRRTIAVLILFACGGFAQENISAMPDGITLAVRLEQSVDTAKVHSGDAVRARLLSPILLRGKIAIPKNAEIAGRVLEAEPLRPMRVSRLAIRFDEARWDDGAMTLHAYIVRQLALKSTVSTPYDRDLDMCPPTFFHFLGNQQSASGSGSTAQQTTPPQKSPPPPPPPPPPVTPRPQPRFDRCDSIQTPARRQEKVTFTSPLLKGLEIRHLTTPAGATELTSSTKNVALKRGTMLELRNALP